MNVTYIEQPPLPPPILNVTTNATAANGTANGTAANASDASGTDAARAPEPEPVVKAQPKIRYRSARVPVTVGAATVASGAVAPMSPELRKSSTKVRAPAPCPS